MQAPAERYKQRDIFPSHIFRQGIHLFGDKERICRRRLINCSIKDVHNGIPAATTNNYHESLADTTLASTNLASAHCSGMILTNA